MNIEPLKTAVGRLEAARQKARELQARKAQLDTELLEIDPTDADALKAAVLKRTESEAIPGFITKTLGTRMEDAAAQVMTERERLSTELKERANAELERAVSRIAAVLKRFWPDTVDAVNGETGSPALGIARSAPVLAPLHLTIERLGRLQSFNLQPRSNNPESFDRTAVEIADELLGMAEKWQANGGSFLPKGALPA